MDVDLSELLYQVKPFQSCELDNSRLLVATQLGSFVIEDPSMRQFVEFLNERVNSGRNRCISHPDLAHQFQSLGLPQHEAMAYLTNETGILVNYSSGPNDALTNIHIVSDSSVFTNLLGSHITNSGFPNVTIGIDDNDDTSNSLIILHMNAYDSENVKSLYDKHRSNPGVIFSVSYLLSTFAYIDSIYFPNHGTPCHFCHVGELKNQSAWEATQTNDSFFYLYNYIVLNRLPMPLALPPTDLQTAVVAWNMFLQIQPLIDKSPTTQRLAEDFGMMTSINLSTGEYKRDMVVHWDYCDCISFLPSGESND